MAFPLLSLGASIALGQTGSDIRGTVTASENRGPVIGARVSVAAPFGFSVLRREFSGSIEHVASVQPDSSVSP
jgi:hypothetical protein